MRKLGDWVGFHLCKYLSASGNESVNLTRRYVCTSDRESRDVYLTNSDKLEGAIDWTPVA